MKKLLIIFCSIILTISLSYYLYTQIVNPLFRYSTPTEAFEKSTKWGYELKEILQDKDIALIIYTEKEYIYNHHIISKDSRGWTPLSINYKDIKSIPYKNGFISLKQIGRKNIILIDFSSNSSENFPVISDNINSEFLTYSSIEENNIKLFYGFLVLEQELPEDYSIIINNEKIPININ